MTNESGLEFEYTDADVLGKSTPLIRAARDAARELFKVKSDEDMKMFLGHWGHLIEKAELAYAELQKGN